MASADIYLNITGDGEDTNKTEQKRNEMRKKDDQRYIEYRHMDCRRFRRRRRHCHVGFAVAEKRVLRCIVCAMSVVSSI
jgi:hypothetical protein